MADEYILKSYDGGAETTTLTSPFTVSGTTLVVANGSTFPDGSSGPFVVVVDRGLATEEKFLIDTTTGTNGTTFNIQQDAYDGTSASSHAVGATVEHCLDAYSLEQANRYVNLQSARGDLIAHNNITTTKLAVGANNTVLVADSAQSLGLKYSTVGSASIADNAIIEAKLADDAVTKVKIADSAVDAARLDTASAGTTGQVLARNTSASSGIEWQTLVTASSMPSGSITMFGGDGVTAPSGWLYCRGQAVSRTENAALFSAISTTYGSGNGTSTFNLPDLQSKFPVGKGSASWSNVIAEAGGSANSVVVTHSHGGVTQQGISTANITIHDTPGLTTNGNHVTGYGAGGSTGTIGDGTNTFPGAVHDHVINPDGVSGTNQNLPPYITLNFIIKT